MPKAATILIIDDTPEDRDFYKDLLSQYDDFIYSFVDAEDAENALDVCSNVEIDCILLDYSLPGIDGLTLLQKLKERAKIGRNSTLAPVVMITGRGSENVAVQALKEGAVDYLVKSELDGDSLYRATKNAVERTEYERALAIHELRRSRNDAELRQSEEKFRLLVDAVKDYALVMLDEEGRIISWNSGARRLLGYHDGEILGQHYRKLFIQADIKSQVPEKELVHAATIGRSMAERFHLRRDGTAFWTEGTISPVRDATGALRGFAKVFKDNSDLRNAREERNTHQNRLNLVLEVSPFGIMVFEGTSGKLLFCNQEVRALAADSFRPDAETVFECFVDASGRSVTLPGLAEIVSGSHREFIEVEWKLGNASTPVGLWAGTLHATESQPETVVVFIQDLTQTRKSAVQLRNAVEARDEFLSVASHELKSPLTALKLQCEIFERLDSADHRMTSEQLRTIVDIVTRQTGKLTHIVADLLDVSRLNAGNFKLDKHPTELGSIVRSALEQTQDELNEAECRVTLSLAQPLSGNWDEARLKQVVENLLTNVAKYASGSKVEVELHQENERAVLSVIDHGPGIPEHYQEVIFERFARARGSNRVSGLGLGLFIAKKVVKAHGGEIWVQSRPNQGAQFTISLPLNS